MTTTMTTMTMMTMMTDRDYREWAIIIWGRGLTTTSALFLCLLPSGFPRTGLLGSSLNKRSGDPASLGPGLSNVPEKLRKPGR